jgi:AraC-like DNA-binding protein
MSRSCGCWVGLPRITRRSRTSVKTTAWGSLDAYLLRDVQSLVCVPLPKDAGATRLLLNCVPAVLTSDALESRRLRDLMAAHVCDLVVLAIAPKPDVVADAQSRGLAAARLHATKTDILADLANNDLTESALAKHRLTPRYMRMLFAAEGMTFSDFVRRSRLTRAHQLLTDRLNGGRTIGSIAYEAGFVDLSHFSRLFRNHYGARPSDIRAQKHSFF